jgi:apolipoprotein N-acyltransferase
VPFSEYQPAGWKRLAIRGRSQYSPGQGSQLIHLPDLALGGFICQEVLVPWVTRQSVRDGATLLVSGGNDGVFASPAVARVHADAAQLRAVETGRDVVRAMKTGISAVIDPWGRERERSRSSEPAMLVSEITPLTGHTPYVRFGDWLPWFSLALIMGTFPFPKKM